MRTTLFIFLFGVLAWTASAQVPREHMRLYTDKECYLAGEELWIKVCVTDSLYRDYPLSKVAYIEISDAKQIYSQAKVALENGTGWARIKLNPSMHSGTFRLMGYTRYMRNYPSSSFPKKYIAVLNAGQVSDEDAVDVVPDSLLESQETPTYQLQTDKPLYKNRDKVTLQLPQLPASLRELSLAVVRKDYTLPPYQAVNEADEHVVSPGNKRYIAECEGHIAAGRLVTGVPDSVFTRLSCVGKDIRIFDGRLQPDGTYFFFTTGITDMQDVVLTSIPFQQSDCRPELVSPFMEALPKQLPPLRLACGEEALLERSQGVQIYPLLPVDTLQEKGGLLKQLHSLVPTASYNLDEYVRFNTVREALIEFVVGVGVSKNAIRTLQSDINRFSRQKTLVLLDGIPIENHEAALNYNAHMLHYIHRYGGQYSFGGKIYDGIVSMITHKGTLPEMMLDINSQLLAYEFPQDRSSFRLPVYETPAQKLSRVPDFRHTLYWNPTLTPSERTFTFYTSDLNGDYEVTLRGITEQGEPVEMKGFFRVEGGK